MACVLLAAAVAACGKKGPPLAPYVHIPAAVERMTVRRLGSDVYLTVTIPSRNVDASVPVDIGRVDIYGYTGTSMPGARRLIEGGTLVATVEVPPVLAGAAETAPAPPAGGDAAAVLGPVPGGQVTVVESLTGAALVAAPSLPDPVAPALPVRRGARAPRLHRYYGAVAFSPSGRPGPPQVVLAEVPLVGLPEVPTGVAAEYTATELTLTWDAVMAPVGSSPDAEPDETADAPAADDMPAEQAALVTYNVYRDADSDLRPAAALAPPTPVNAVPLARPRLTDVPRFGRRVCYRVRAVVGSGATALEGEASAPVCLTPEDRFAPAAPRSLASVASDGAVSLIWEPNDEADLAGYLVLRGSPGDVTLLTLTPEPLPEPRYRDTAVTAGVRYVYAVVAIDNRLPTPNRSAESNRVEEGPR